MEEQKAEVAARQQLLAREIGEAERSESPLRESERSLASEIERATAEERAEV